MRFIIFSSFLVLLFYCISNNEKLSEAEKKLPNILLFIGDDMTWSDCEPYGNKQVKTPKWLIENWKFNLKDL